MLKSFAIAFARVSEEILFSFRSMSFDIAELSRQSTLVPIKQIGTPGLAF